MKRLLSLAVAAACLPGIGLAQNTIKWTDLQGAIANTVGGIQMHGTAVVEAGGKDYLYIVGGNRQNTPAGQPGIVGGDTDLVWYAELISLNPVSVGTWQQATWTFPLYGDPPRVENSAYITRSTFGYNGRLYIVGGRTNNGGSTNQYNGVRVFEPTATGDILAEATALGFDGAAAGASPPLNRLELCTAVDPATGYLYVAGGNVAGVQRLTINQTTGAVTDLINLTATTAWNPSFSEMLIKGNYLYIFGSSVAADRAKVQFAEILGDGTLSNFTDTAPLPEGRFDGGGSVMNGEIYVVAGTASDNLNVRNTVFRSVSGANGQITSWATDAEIPGTLPEEAGAVPGLRRVGVVSFGEEGFGIFGGRSYNANFLGNLYFATPLGSNVSDWSIYN